MSSAKPISGMIPPRCLQNGRCKLLRHELGEGRFVKCRRPLAHAEPVTNSGFTRANASWLNRKRVLSGKDAESWRSVPCALPASQNCH
jgi:hypothetical protein